MTDRQAPPANKWRTIGLISVAELFVLAVWFSASAILPALTDLWHLGASGQAWLTMSVQIGFVVGALGSAILNLADRIPPKWFFVVSALLASTATLLIPLFPASFTFAIICRFLTGMCLAGVYPVGMKIMTTWTKRDRGLGIGLLVGALTIGSASPHLLKALGGVDGRWQLVMILAGFSAALGALIVAFFIDEGPYKTATVRFQLKQVTEIVKARSIILANLGYLGHMWELYAMWSWLAVFLLASFKASQVENHTAWASAMTFVAIASGGIGSFVAGKFADTIGRTTVTSIALGISGLCSLGIGQLYGHSPVLLSGVAIVWGVFIIADSAQFSACVSELCEPQLIGTALTLQTSMGFLLTLVSIRMIPTLERWFGWQWAFAFLAIGPLIGIWAMQTLRHSPDALQLASGRR